MHRFKGEYDGVAKRYQCVAELMSISQPRGTKLVRDQITEQARLEIGLVNM